ncbi:MAG: hypothetical protein FJW39_33985 [Acidobacteria bacterium]|nr:hypothetical protein [Acidobacteriota bacterium]
MRCEIPAQLADCRQVEDLLPREALEMLRSATGEGEGAMLLLEESLPAQLVRLEWESLTIAGRELKRSALVARRARPKFDNSLASSDQPARWLNLFPRAEFDFSKPLEELIAHGALRPTTREAFAVDVARACDLFVVAHADVRGLMDKNGTPFGLPRAGTLPERVWLLACNKAHAMDLLAAKLLDQGAGCVISASGDLSAPQMLEVIRRWLTRADGQDVASWLVASRAASETDGGIGSLRIWGNVHLDRSDSSSWNAATWAIEHGDPRSIPLGTDAGRKTYFLAKEAYAKPETWARTREWMTPRLLWLAEHYEHAAMEYFEKALPQPRHARDYVGLYAKARRLGNYPWAARYLARGFSLTERSVEEHADLLGGLTNLLIDLNLPRTAGVAVAAFEDCVVTDAHARRVNDLRRLDYRARIAAREGKLSVAMDRLREKHEHAATMGDSRRELSGLLYMAVWGLLSKQVQESEGVLLASQVRNDLAIASPAEIGAGNETAGYLLRALAAYFWVNHDPDVLPQLARWQEHALARLRTDDPGPWAYMFAFLHLSDRVDFALFERAIEALVRAQYLLEADMFLLLARRQDKFTRLLPRYQKRREQTIAELGPLPMQIGMDVEAECKARIAIEETFPRGPQDIVVKGLMPL